VTERGKATEVGIMGAFVRPGFERDSVEMRVSTDEFPSDTVELRARPSCPAGPVYLDVKGLVQLAASALALAAKLNGGKDV
jgi:hypothetical protein